MHDSRIMAMQLMLAPSHSHFPANTPLMRRWLQRFERTPLWFSGGPTCRASHLRYTMLFGGR